MDVAIARHAKAELPVALKPAFHEPTSPDTPTFLRLTREVIHVAS